MNAQVLDDKPTKEQVRKKLQRLRKKYREKVKGIFRFHEVPGGTLSFVYKMFKEDPVERFTFVDGQQYEIPLGVAIHLNKNCWYPEHSYQTDENGRPTAVVGKKVQRAGFQSLEFIDDDEFVNESPGVLEVKPLAPIKTSK